LEIMKTFPSNHFSSIVTDPPYGLKFMGKDWDHGTPGIEFWKEALRISKPGAFLVSMGGTRTFHRLTCAIEDAGWEIRDCISYLYGSGFPKSHNHFGIEGFGTALKPAWEPCIMAMKPIDGTFAQNAEKWGQAGINIDGCRVPSDGEHYRAEVKGRGESFLNERQGMYTEGRGFTPTNSPKGRWPANVIFDEEAARLLDQQSGILKSGSHKGYLEGESQNKVYGKRAAKNINSFEASSGGASRFFYCPKTSSRERNEGLDCYLTVKHDIDQTRDLWLEESTVAAELLKRDIYGLIEHLSIDVSGESITAQFHKDFSSIIKTKIRQIIESKTSNLLMLSPTNEFIRDVGSWLEIGSNRVVNVELKKMFQRLITNGEMVSALGVSNVALKMLSLISDEENWKERKSTHPTVKPLALMRYLITLVAPPTNALILDPFAGSGSTILAAKQLGISAIGIEKQPEYVEISKKRVESYIPQQAQGQ